MYSAPLETLFKATVAIVFLLGILLPDLLCAQASRGKTGNPVSSPAQKYIEQGKLQLDKGQYSRAVRFFSRAIAADKGSSSAYKLRGVSYSRLGAYHRAVTDFSRYIELNPSDLTGYLLRGDAHNFSLNHEAALADYTRATRLNPKSVEAYLGRGLAYAGLERYNAAIKEYQWVLKLDPGNRDALSNLGRACMLAGRPMAAMSYLKMALERERDPQWIGRIKVWIAKLVEEAGKTEKPTRGPTRSPRRPGLTPLW